MRCSLCGDSLSDNPPHYYLALGVEGNTTDAQEEESQVCEQCWEQYRNELV